MSFQTGLTGLNAATKNLDVIGNNIANANTVGAKSSRAEFAALVSSAGSSGSDEGQGIGVAVATVAQQFTQGSINITGNSLDVAINGGGFFQITTTEGKPAYTRDGQFKLDRQGNMVTNLGANVMGYALDSSGQPTSVAPTKLTVPSGAPIAASATTSIVAELNLDARAPVANTVTPPTPITTYGTAVTAFDSQGLEVPLQLYFTRVDSTPAAVGPPAVSAADNWAVYVDNPDAVAATATPYVPLEYTTATGTEALVLNFNKSGQLTSPLDAKSIILASTNPVIGNFDVSLDVTKASQFGSAFQVSKLTQDGYTAGDLTGVAIDATGVLETRYSNGQTKRLAQLTLADFRNPQGLTPISGGAWVETFASGQPIQGKPSQGKFGELRAGAVEDSNVDLTAELVAMMTAQRSYQANVQTIKTQDQAVQALVNLR